MRIVMYVIVIALLGVL